MKTTHVWRVIATMTNGQVKSKRYDSLKDARKALEKVKSSGKFEKVQVGFRRSDQQ